MKRIVAVGKIKDGVTVVTYDNVKEVTLDQHSGSD